MSRPAHDRRWRDVAACRGMQTNIFFPGRGGRVDRAKRICARCPSLGFCLADALADPAREDLGVRGGLSEQERKALRRKRAGRLAAVVDLPVPVVTEHADIGEAA